jgi:ribosomal protein S18 acetylase RimI-like enzyme
MLLVEWTDTQREDFLRMQFVLRERAYAMQFPGLNIEMIERDGTSVGQMLTEEREGELLLVDIALSGENRSRGIGAQVVGRLILRAQNLEKKLILRVDKENTRARQFYERNGFEITNESQLQFQMEYLK